MCVVPLATTYIFFPPLSHYNSSAGGLNMTGQSNRHPKRPTTSSMQTWSDTPLLFSAVVKGGAVTQLCQCRPLKGRAESSIFYQIQGYFKTFSSKNQLQHVRVFDYKERLQLGLKVLYCILVSCMHNKSVHSLECNISSSYC